MRRTRPLSLWLIAYLYETSVWLRIWLYDENERRRPVLTFIISSSVLSTMSVMMKYSNGVETTTRQILYFRLSRSLGMYLSNGLAWMAKSIHDFCIPQIDNNKDMTISFLTLWFYAFSIFLKPFEYLIAFKFYDIRMEPITLQLKILYIYIYCLHINMYTYLVWKELSRFRASNIIRL